MRYRCTNTGRPGAELEMMHSNLERGRWKLERDVRETPPFCFSRSAPLDAPFSQDRVPVSVIEKHCFFAPRSYPIHVVPYLVYGFCRTESKKKSTPLVGSISASLRAPSTGDVFDASNNN